MQMQGVERRVKKLTKIKNVKYPKDIARRKVVLKEQSNNCQQTHCKRAAMQTLLSAAVPPNKNNIEPLV